MMMMVADIECSLRHLNANISDDDVVTAFNDHYTSGVMQISCY